LAYTNKGEKNTPQIEQITMKDRRNFTGFIGDVKIKIFVKSLSISLCERESK
jgi:hypothetical protein